MGDGAHRGRASLALDVVDGLHAHVQHQGVHQGHIVALARLLRHLHVAAELREEGDRAAGLDVRVQILEGCVRKFREHGLNQ